MRYRFFAIPALAPEAAQEALNAFCAGHRVLALERHFVEQDSGSYWAVSVTWLESGAVVAESGPRRERKDYREVLDAPQFALFARLRQLRKQLAEQEGVPAYALFTNEQLADMVIRRATSLEALGAIEGVGRARIEKYGAAFVALLCGGVAHSQEAETEHETSAHRADRTGQL